MSHFPAAYPGRCGNCGEVFGPGTEVFYAPPEDVLTGWECCGGLDESRPAVSEESVRVMPRGKTVRDRCSRCFQIPASNGLCGCDA